MILNPFKCENCGEELQPDKIGVDFRGTDLIRICGFCFHEIKLNAGTKNE